MVAITVVAIETAASAIVGAGKRLNAMPERDGQERQHRRQEARAHEAAAEGEVVARVVAHVAEADAADRQCLGALPAFVAAARCRSRPSAARATA